MIQHINRNTTAVPANTANSLHSYSKSYRTNCCKTWKNLPNQSLIDPNERSLSITWTRTYSSKRPGALGVFRLLGAEQGEGCWFGQMNYAATTTFPLSIYFLFFFYTTNDDYDNQWLPTSLSKQLHKVLQDLTKTARATCLYHKSDERKSRGKKSDVETLASMLWYWYSERGFISKTAGLVTILDFNRGRDFKIRHTFY